MFDKKKLNFWRLTVIFLGFIAITLASLWLSPQGKQASMMQESMANMSKMHLENVTIYDLVGSSDSDSGSSDSAIQTTSDNDTHQQEDGTTGIQTLGMITTIIIFTLIPLLLCGIIILAIVWIK